MLIILYQSIGVVKIMLEKQKENEYKNITLKEFIFEKYIKRIFSVLYMTNTINTDDIDIGDVSKRKIFIYNLSFSEWFDLYGRHTLKAKLKQLKRIIIIFVILFVLINIAIFTPFINAELKNKKYPKQSAILISSHLITRIYILPLSKSLGYKNILVLPFYYLRNYLYNKGISMLPANSPERECWWYNTRFLEYASVVDTTISEWFSSHKKPFSEREIKDINNWNNEVYNHILIFPKTDFTSTKYENYQLQIYRDMIDKFQHSMALFSTTQQIVTPYWLLERQKRNGKKYPGPKYEAVQHNLELIDKFDEYKEKIKNENPFAYKKYEEGPIVEEYIMKKNLADNYLLYKDTFEKIDCNSKEFLIWGDMRSKILNYILEKGDSTDPKYVLRYQLSLLSAVSTGICPIYEEKYQKEFEKLSEYFQK